MNYIEIDGVMQVEVPGVTEPGKYHSYKVGDRIRFSEERQSYTVQACDGRFAVCTKPFNAKRTVLYSIADFRDRIRGTENLIFCMGFENREACEEALKRLQDADSEISYRNRTELLIEGRGGIIEAERGTQ